MRAPCMFPRSILGKAWVYMVIRKDDRIKVGFTENPRTRLRKHAVDYAGNIRFLHLFSHVDVKAARAAERDLIRLFAERGTRIGRTEEFDGVSKDDAITWGSYTVARARCRLIAERQRAAGDPLAWANFCHAFGDETKHVAPANVAAYAQQEA